MGGIITADQVHEEKKQSYRSELASLASGGSSKLVLIAMGEGSGMTMIRQSLEGGMFDTFIGADGMRTDKMVASIGGANLKGKLWGTLPSAKPSPQLDKFKSMYGDGKKYKYGSPFTAQGYDAVMLIALSAQMAGSSDRTAIRDNLRKVANAPGVVVGPGDWAKAVAAIKAGKDINYEGASGSHEFDAKGEVAGVFAEYQVEGNKLVDSAPLDIK
jgi:branched-chain amino acid transport system substrate-binding protein